ncbi:MAG: hypothetical protein K0S65_879 [Labilithrix sp.]|nr:hypothetical protein [Labilithrix sp.]
MRSYFLLAALGALAFVGACSSTVEGSGDGNPIPGFDIAVGAEVTLTFRHGICDRETTTNTSASSEGCLAERPGSLKNVSLASSGAFTVLESKLERSGDIVVRLRAQKTGDSALVVEHTSFFGKAMREEFALRSREISDVQETVGCQWPDAPSRRYPVTPASNLIVKLTAMSEATPLLSGALELIVDRGGVDLLDEPGREGRRVRTPSSPGTYTWKVVGTHARPITFEVYDVATVGLDLTSTATGVTVRPAANGAPVCIYEGEARASLNVVEGSCRILIGDFEVEGALPVALKHGGATLEIVGSGCTVEGSMKTGSVDRVVVPPLDNRPPFVPATGEPIGLGLLEKGGTLEPPGTTCGRVSKVGNGKCEAINAAGYVLPDGDCFSDWEWKLQHLDGTGSANATFERGPVGVGLLTELHVSVEFSILGLGLATYSPNSLGFGAVPPPGLELQRLGCNGSKYEALGIRANSAGVHPLGMVADNAPGPRVYDVEARAVATVSYLKDSTDPLVGTVARSKFFVGSRVPLALKYTDSANTELRGVSPLRITGSDANAEAKLAPGSDIFTGTKPNVITLASAAAPQTQVLDVVDATAITEIGGLGPQDARSIFDEQCVEPFPQASGQRIRGTSPERARVAFTGDGCAVGGGAPWAAAPIPSKLCLLAGGPPATDVRVSWGPTATATWSCAKP